MGSTGNSGVSPNKNSAQTPLTSSSSDSDVINYFKNQYNMDIGGSWFKNGCDTQILIDMSSQMDRLKSELGQDVFNDMNLRIVSHKMRTQRAYAYTELGSNQIVVNSPHYADINKANANVRGDIAKGYHPTGTTIGSTLVHEFGHNLEFLINKRLHPNNTYMQRLADADQSIAKAIVKGAYTDISSSNPGMFRNEKQARASISGYADSLWHGAIAYTETMAEAVSDYAKNGQNAKPMSIAIWNNIKKML